MNENIIESKAVNLKKENPDIYIGRGSIWGNPFEMKSYTNNERNRVCEEYEVYFWETELSSRLGELVGKTLGCYCKPKRCHGDFLASLANNLDKVNEYKKITLVKRYIRGNRQDFNDIKLKQLTIQVSNILMKFADVDEQIFNIKKVLFICNNSVEVDNYQTLSHLNYLSTILKNE